MDFTGTTGDDTLTGTTGDDLFKVFQGGNDTVSGLTGTDVFNFAGTLTAADTIDGGGGQDTVQIKGDYSAGVIFGAATMVNVETLQMAAGFNYTITTDDATVAAGAVLTLNASALAEANALTFNGSNETDGLLHVHGGAGNDTIGMGANMVADDHFDGGDGNDELIVGGSNSLTLKSVTIHNIEEIQLLPTFAGSLAFNSGNVLAGQTIEIDGSGITAASYTINAHNLPGNVVFDGGPHSAKVTTGSGADTFNMGANFSRDDRLAGGDGNDTLNLNGTYNLTLASGTITGIDQVNLAGGHNYHVTSTGNLVINQTMAVNATGLTASDSLYLDFSSETAGSVIIDGGAAPAILKGGQQGDAFDFAVTSQGGLTASDQIDGQGGYDHLYFDGDYTGSHALVMNATTVINVEEFDFEAGHSYNITIAAATVLGDNGLSKVDARQLGASDSLTFNAAAAPQQVDIDFFGGAGNDVLTGGGGENIFDLSAGGNDTVTGGNVVNLFLMGATLNSADRLDGLVANSNSIVELNGDYGGAHAVTLSSATIKNISQINLDAGHDYNITYTGTSAPTVGFILDAGGLSTSNSVTLDFSAEIHTANITLIGGAGNDHILGAKGGTIELDRGGDDTADLQGGTAIMGSKLNTNDVLSNVGILDLSGNYDAAHGTALNLTTANLSGGGTAKLEGGFAYDITVSSADVLAGVLVTNGASLIFNGAAETTKAFNLNIGSGNITLGGGDDSVLSGGVGLTFHGNGGDDTVKIFTTAFSASQIDGGSGNDTLIFQGNQNDTFSGSDLIGVENIQFTGTSTITMADGNVAAGATLTVTASIGTLTFNGQAETDGHFAVSGTHAGSNHIVGGALSDTLSVFNTGNTVEGLGGGDTIDLSSDSHADTITYLAVSDSTGANYDTLVHLNFNTDHLDVHLAMSTGSAPTGVNGTVSTGALSTASFDTDLAAAINAAHLGADHAVLFTPDSGTLAGHKFLIVDANGIAGYQADADLVMDVTGAKGPFGTEIFI